MLLQIAAAAFMAVSVLDGLGKNSGWFALSYAAIRTILVIEYLRDLEGTFQQHVS